MKYGIKIMEPGDLSPYWVKPNFRDFFTDGIPVTEKVSEALTGEKVMVEADFERIKYAFRNRPDVLTDLSVCEIP